MASRDESDTRSEDNNLWPQIPFWGPDHEPADRNTYPQIDAFSLLSIMTPHRSQPHPTEPGPFFHSWDNTLPAQVLTQHGHGRDPAPWESEVHNDAAMDEHMHNSNPTPIGVGYGTSGYIPWRQDIVPEHVDTGSTDTVQRRFDGSHRQTVLREEYPGTPDDYHIIGHSTPDTQPLPSHTTSVSYVPTHELAERVTVPPLDAVSAQAPWSVLNTRDNDAHASVAGHTAMQHFPWTGTGSGTFPSNDATRTADSVRFFASDVDGTTGTNELDQSTMTIRPGYAGPSFDWMDSSEYTFGEQQYDQHGLVLPRLHVPAYIPDGEGNDDGDTVPQYIQDQGTDNDQYLSVHSESATSHSEASSPMSITSPGVPEVVCCDECDTEFQGEYRRGNLNRHRRLYHGSQSGYPCHDTDCRRVFRRQDARLKHHRRHHPHLGEHAPKVRRGSYQGET